MVVLPRIIKSQYRSHGYLFNHKKAGQQGAEVLSQYRSHGYLFNLQQDL